MTVLLLVLLLGMLLMWLGIAWRLWQADRAMPVLDQEPPAALPDGAPWPPLSVIVPARNEAAHVRRAVGSLLALDYPALRVVAVDDRSQDDTGAQLEALAADDARLTVLRVQTLPDGWLGKNHANHLAARHVLGKAESADPQGRDDDLLLFTDADVVFAPGALRSAVALMHAHRLGHLVAAPRLVAPGFWERAFQSTFGLYYLLRCRAWALRRPGSRAFVGMGAFNLVRRADYARIGGHTALAREVVDDVKLGLLLRRAGTPQALASAGGLISVRWQAGFWASLGGLLKNIFPDAEYRWRTILGSAALLLLAGCGPPLALLVLLVSGLPGAGGGGPVPDWLLLTTAVPGALLPALLLGAAARNAGGGSGLEGLAYPVTHAAFAGTVIASALLTTLRGGLVWRDTVYPLAELRAHVIRERDLPPHNAVGW